MAVVSGYNIDKIAEKLIYKMKLNKDNDNSRFKLKQLIWYVQEENKYPEILIYMALGVLYQKKAIKFEKLGRSSNVEEGLRVKLEL